MHFKQNPVQTNSNDRRAQDNERMKMLVCIISKAGIKTEELLINEGTLKHEQQPHGNHRKNIKVIKKLGLKNEIIKFLSKFAFIFFIN